MLKDGVEDRIKERIDKIKSGKAKAKLISDISYPQRQLAQDKFIIDHVSGELEKLLPNILELIKNIRPYFKNIWDQNNIVAIYLLLGKAYKNLQGVIGETKKGNITNLIELCRSGHEAVDLAILFSGEDGDKFLADWFKGKIIVNDESRKSMDKAVNEMLSANSGVPVAVKEMKADTYWTYSQFTHSGYGAMFEMIDPFHEDFDFEGYAGHHYTRRSIHVVDNLAVNILLGLKNTFLLCKDPTNLSKTELLLSMFDGQFASPEEIAEVQKKYKKQS